MAKHVTLISQYAFYPMHWEAFRFLCTHYNARGSVITPPLPELPPLHRQLGWVGIDEARQEAFQPDVRQMPPASRRAQRNWLHTQLDSLQPDAIWVQEEPTNRLLIEVLKHYRHDRRPTIVCALAENIFRIRWWRQWLFSRRWSRLDRLIAVATPSIEGIRSAGMPSTVAADSLVAGAQAAPEPLEPMDIPLCRKQGDFVVGFAGRICAEKGWDLLLEAIETLPAEFQVAFAGDGPQANDLSTRLKSPGLAARAVYVGPLPKSELWTFYKAVDCIATPHRTFPRWKEQFGGVLADAMALGLPIVGSDSGAIPEVVGSAGLIFPEDHVGELAAAIRRLRDEPGLARQLSHAGQARFQAEFAIPAYARKIAKALQLDPRSSSHVAAA